MQYGKNRSPHRHNYEHDVHTLSGLLRAAGFDIDILKTVDVFYEPRAEAMKHLEKNGFPTTNRGDDIMALATKVGPVRERWPDIMYIK